MARTKVNSTRLGSIYVRPEYAAYLDRLAQEDGVTINHLVREALRLYFEKRGIA